MTALQAVTELLDGAYAVGDEFHYLEITEMVDYNETTVSGVLSELVRAGRLDRVPGKRGTYKVLPAEPVRSHSVPVTFDLVKVRADGSRIMTDEAGELYIVTLVVI